MMIKRLLVLSSSLLMACAATFAVAYAQRDARTGGHAGTGRIDGPAAPASEEPTFIDRQYDGHTHVTLAPYIWLPTLRQNVQFNAPTRSDISAGAPIQGAIQVGTEQVRCKYRIPPRCSPSTRAKAMSTSSATAFPQNLSSSATIDSIFSGPEGGEDSSVLTANSRVSASYLEIAAGFTVAHGHNADLSAFAGWLTIPARCHGRLIRVPSGKRRIDDPTRNRRRPRRGQRRDFRTARKSIFRARLRPVLRGLAPARSTRPGKRTPASGYAFNHGQTILAAYRSLNYNAFPANSSFRN